MQIGLQVFTHWWGECLIVWSVIEGRHRYSVRINAVIASFVYKHQSILYKNTDRFNPLGHLLTFEEWDLEGLRNPPPAAILTRRNNVWLNVASELKLLLLLFCCGSKRGLHSGSPSKDLRKGLSAHTLNIVTADQKCSRWKNENKMDSGLREREHLLALKGTEYLFKDFTRTSTKWSYQFHHILPSFG